MHRTCFVALILFSLSSQARSQLEQTPTRQASCSHSLDDLYRRGATVNTHLEPVSINGWGGLRTSVMACGHSAGDGFFGLSTSDSVSPALVMSDFQNGARLEVRSHSGHDQGGIFSDPDAGGGLSMLLGRSDQSSGVLLDGNHLGQQGSRIAMFRDSFQPEIVLDSNSSGDLSVQFPNNAISAVERGDEAGVAGSWDGTWHSFGGQPETATSGSIHAPTAGYVLALASGTVGVNHIQGSPDQVCLGISLHPETLPGNARSVVIDESPTSSLRRQPVTVHRLVPVTPGTHTFYFNADGTPFTHIIAPRLTLLFIPNAFGAVSSSESSGVETLGERPGSQERERPSTQDQEQRPWTEGWRQQTRVREFSPSQAPMDGGPASSSCSDLDQAYQEGHWIHADQGPVTVTHAGTAVEGPVLTGSPGVTDGFLSFSSVDSAFPTLEARRSSHGASLNFFSDAGFFLGNLASDSNDGGGLILDLGRNESSPGFFIDGNRLGAQSPWMGIFGESRSIIFDLTSTGDSSVVFPEGSISSREAPEASTGTASHETSTSSFTANVVQAHLSRSITVPGEGFVMAIASSQVRLNHSTIRSRCTLGVSNRSNQFSENQSVNFSLDQRVPAGGYESPVTVQSMFPVAGGTHHFYLLASHSSGSSAVLSQKALILVYFPSQYGTVSAPTFANP